MDQTPAIMMRAIGSVCGGRVEPVDDSWDEIEAEIALDPVQIGVDATAGLDQFSHIEVVYSFNLVPETSIETGARHPRGRPAWPKVGILAQRGKSRPNRIGVTVCRLLSVDRLRLRVQRLDAIDGTPVLDIKPVMAGFLPRGAVREPD